MRESVIYQEILEEGRQEGRQSGLQEGRQSGLQEGRQAGLQEGRQSGLQEGRQAGLQEGRQEGRQSGEVALVLRLVQRRMGAMDEAIASRIRSLPMEQLETLAEALLDFTQPQELITWLDHHPQ